MPIRFKAILFAPSAVAGVCSGVYLRNRGSHEIMPAWDWTSPRGVGAMFAIFIAVILFSFFARRPLLGFTPLQFRLIWVTAFLIRAFGMPLIYQAATT